MKFLNVLHTKPKQTKKKNKRRGAKIQSNFITIISKTPENLSLVTLVTNYLKLLLLPFVVRL